MHLCHGSPLTYTCVAVQEIRNAVSSFQKSYEDIILSTNDVVEVTVHFAYHTPHAHHQ